jgi:RHS repeat-associated protein
MGNRLSLVTGNGSTSYEYDAANRLTSVNGVVYTWDNNGNLLNDGLRSYTYDHANRLTQVANGTLTTEFTYNGVGDRAAKTVDGVTTDYVLDPAAGLTQVLQGTTAGQTTSYLYGADLLAQYDSGTWAYHVYDGLGSVRHLADPVGQVVQSYSFSPFGVPLGESGGEPYGFTGEWWDADAALLYLRARWYEPGVGRFISKDPLSGFVSNLQSFNLYTYVLGNPIKYIDPSGRIVEAEADYALARIKQLQREYGVTIVVDFGWRTVPHPAPGERVSCVEWEEGAWRNVEELETVLQVAQRFEDRAGSREAARRAIGGVTIRRISQGGTQHFLGEITIADYSFDQPDAKGPLKRQWGPKVAIAHELAHYWDWKTGTWWSKILGFGAVVALMPIATRGEPGPTLYARTSIVEDWAETVAGYLFREYFAFLPEEAPEEVGTYEYPRGIERPLPGLLPRHYAYVVAQFHALHASTSLLWR